jgi:hypothetical protein
MTVQELINHLQQFNSETKVVFYHTDHTDWTYKIEMYEDGIFLGDMREADNYEDDFDEEEEVVEFTLFLD